MSKNDDLEQVDKKLSGVTKDVEKKDKKLLSREYLHSDELIKEEDSESIDNEYKEKEREYEWLRLECEELKRKNRELKKENEELHARIAKMLRIQAESNAEEVGGQSREDVLLRNFQQFMKQDIVGFRKRILSEIRPLPDSFKIAWVTCCISESIFCEEAKRVKQIRTSVEEDVDIIFSSIISVLNISAEQERIIKNRIKEAIFKGMELQKGSLIPVEVDNKVVKSIVADIKAYRETFLIATDYDFDESIKGAVQKGIDYQNRRNNEIEENVKETSNNIKLKIEEIYNKSFPNVLDVQLFELVKKGVGLIDNIMNAVPPGEIWIGKEGELFDPDIHEAFPDCVDSKGVKISFTVFPGYKVCTSDKQGGRIFAKAVVYTGVDVKVDVGVEPKVDVGVEPKVDVGVEPKVDVGVEPKVDVGVEPKVDVGVEPKVDVGANPNVNTDANFWVKAGINPMISGGINHKANADIKPKVSTDISQKLNVGISPNPRVSTSADIKKDSETNVKDNTSKKIDTMQGSNIKDATEKNEDQVNKTDKAKKTEIERAIDAFKFRKDAFKFQK